MDAKKIRECAAEMIRFADSCEAKEQPPKPSQAWLDTNSIDIVCGPMPWREACEKHAGELSICHNGEGWRLAVVIHKDMATVWPEEPTCIVRKRAAATPPAGLLQGDWEHTGELREPRELEDGSYEPWMDCTGIVNTDKPYNDDRCPTCKLIPGYTDSRRWIVRPKAKQPVPTAADIPDGWQIDQGPMTWREACALKAEHYLYVMPAYGDMLPTWCCVHTTTPASDCRPDDITYTLKPVAKPAPKVTPWTLSQIPVGGVRRWKDQPSNRYIISQQDTHGDSELSAWATNGEWCWPHEQFDDKWRPCGEVAK